MKSRTWLLAWAGWFGLTAFTAHADDPAPAGLQVVPYLGQNYWVRTVEPGTEDLRLYLRDDQGRGLRDFYWLQTYIEKHHGSLEFAANAGMFDLKAAPVGLLVLDGQEKSPLNLHVGDGNFFMKPNGVFLINQKREAMVIESSTYTALVTPVVWATQSGPLLVQGGNIHPAFIAGSVNKKLRSGVGVRKDGSVVFAISRGPVNFYDFASLFLKKFDCPDALYLDGEISAFYTPGLKDNTAHAFGPMFGLVK